MRLFRTGRGVPTIKGMIEVQGLSKRYGDRVAVDDLSFTVKPGIVTGFLGPNGAGKSTTMRLILGLDRPSAGWATVNGRAYRDLRGAAARGRRAARGASDPHRPQRLQPPAGAGPDPCHRPRSRRRGDPAGGPRVRRPQAGRRVLAGYGPAARHRRRAAGRSRHADPGRAVQRPRPGGHPLDPKPAEAAGRRGSHGVRLLAPDERDRAHGRAAGRDRPWPADRRHLGGGVRAQRLRRRRRPRALCRSGPAGRAAGGSGRARRGRRRRPVGAAARPARRSAGWRSRAASPCPSWSSRRSRWRTPSCASPETATEFHGDQAGQVDEPVGASA